MIGIIKKKPNAAGEFVQAMITHFPPFRWEEHEEKSWALTIANEMKGFSDEVINKARADIVRTRKDRRTPLVSECVNACVEAKRWLEAQNDTQLLNADPPLGHKYPEWTKERMQLSLDLMRGDPMGKEAAKNGWVAALDTFIRKNARMPKGHEIDRCKKSAREFDQTYAELVRNPSLPFAVSLQAWGADVLAKRNKLADLVLRGN